MLVFRQVTYTIAVHVFILNYLRLRLTLPPLAVDYSSACSGGVKGSEMCVNKVLQA